MTAETRTTPDGVEADIIRTVDGIIAECPAAMGRMDFAHKAPPGRNGRVARLPSERGPMPRLIKRQRIRPAVAGRSSLGLKRCPDCSDVERPDRLTRLAEGSPERNQEKPITCLWSAKFR
jgi:hypothetical protein